MVYMYMYMYMHGNVHSMCVHELCHYFVAVMNIYVYPAYALAGEIFYTYLISLSLFQFSKPCIECSTKTHNEV